jgi:hypothetical protein
MHCLSTGGGGGAAAGTGGVYVTVDVLDHTGKILFIQNEITSNDMKFDRVLWGRLHVVYRN